jgi:ATP-binding cassette, subfamily C, bacterial CydC
MTSSRQVNAEDSGFVRALISSATTVLDSSRFRTELLTPGCSFPAGCTVVVATHRLPADFAGPTVKLGACE